MSESYFSVTFITARIVITCQSTLVGGMFIWAGIVRDLVRDHARAAHVRATLVRANLLSHMIYSLIHKMKDSLDLWFNRGGFEGEVDSTKSPSEPNRAGIHLLQLGLSDLVRTHLSEPCLSQPELSETMWGTMSKLHMSGLYLSGPHLSGRIIRDYVRARFHSRVYQRVCQSHITPTIIVRDHIRATLVTVERWWIPGSCCSTNLIRKISIIAGRSYTADTYVKPSHLQYVHITIGWWTCLESPLHSCPMCIPIYTVTFDHVIELTFEFASR